MTLPIEPGFMVFFAEGDEGIGAVRQVSENAVLIYVENGGEFLVPHAAIKSVHDGKVVLDPKMMDRKLLDAIGHAHDAEDPKLAG